MKKLIINKPFVFSALLSLIPLLGSSQTIFWCETFDAGGPACNNQGVGWTLSINGPGFNDVNANPWIINTNCAACGPSAGNRLHITCEPTDLICTILGVGNCLYNAGPAGASATDKFASSPDISTIGRTNITFTFWYQSSGQVGFDYGLVRLSDDGGVTWTDLGTQYAGTSACTQETIAIPAIYENISNFRIAFRWINNDDGTGFDPPFAVDDIELSVPAVVSPPIANFVTSDTMICEGTCISFTDSSTNTPASWEWSFPGATPDTSNDQNPVSICYSAPGNYTVTLVATNSSGSDDTTMTNYIIVDTASTAYAGPDTNICDTGSYTITGATIGGSATSLLWTTSGSGTFDDSTLLAAIYTPSASDTAAGCVILTITTNDPAGPCAADADSMVLCFYSCAAPVANFIASDTTICDSTCINFSDLSTNNPTSWSWSFTGGTPPASTGQNPTGICYNTAGTYDVTLIATNAFGPDIITKTIYIIVDPCIPPVANFIANDTTICDSTCINFTDLSTNNPTSWSWSFPGATPPASIDQNPTGICYNTVGAYDVTLIATNTYGWDIITINNFITVDSCNALVADFSSSDTIFCEGACIDFTDLSMNATGWMWYFPGGTPDTSTAQNPTGICFDTAGAYTISLVATDTSGQDSIAKTNFIIVNSCPSPVADFSSSDTTFCVGACIDFSDLSSNTPTSWAWSFPGAVPSSDTLKNPVGICYDTAGTYDVILTVTNASGTDDTTFTGYITVNSCPAPVANFTASDTVICEGDTVNFTALSPNTTTWAWLFPGGTPPVSNDSTFSVIYSSSGTYSVTLTVSNVNGSDTLIQTSYITVNPLPTVNLGADITFCIGDSAVLDAGASFSSYLWQDGSANQTLTTDTAGIYFVKVTDLNGCEGNDTVILTVNSLLPVANFGYSDSSLTVTFTDSSVNTTMWVWDFGDGNTDTLQNPVHTYASAGTYNVCLTAGNACDSNTSCVSITVTCIPPKAGFSFEDVLLSVMFSDSSDYATVWSWDFGDGNTDTQQNPAHIYDDSGTYNVCLIAGNDCGTDSTCKLVKVIKIPLFIPTAFSPNADGVNDVFRIIGSGITKIYLAVYDRWGVRVFETEDIKEAIETGWDGKYKRKEQGMAVFVYYVKVKFVDGTSDTKKGDLTLIR